MTNSPIKKLVVRLLVSTILIAGNNHGQTPNRYRTFLFGIDYYPEQWPPSLWQEDVRRMRECGVNTARIGEFAWALMGPREGTSDFELFDRAIAVLAK